MAEATVSNIPKDTKRLAFLPIVNPGLDKYYQLQKSVFWTPQEIPFKTDREQFEKMDPGTKEFVTFIISLFAQLDGIVNDNLVNYFKKETAELAKECSSTYAMFEAIEVIHNETYSMMIVALISDPDERERALDSINHYESIRAIAEWTYGWMKSGRPLLERLLAFICIEGIIFMSPFAGIYWIKRMNKLPGLTKANEWISRDEAIHTGFGCALYHHITSIWNTEDARRMPDGGLKERTEPLSTETVNSIITSAVDIAERFTREALKTELVGLDSTEMIGYIKCTADKVCESLGFPLIYNVQNPFDWMAMISLPNKSNIFESRVTEYSRDTSDVFEFDLNASF